jgi:hypothetical protein
LVIAALLFLEPCKDTSITTITTVLTPIDVVFLLDASGSMTDNRNNNGKYPWSKQVEATATLLDTLITESNHSATNGTFQSSIVQWSGAKNNQGKWNQSPGTDATKISADLTNNNTDLLLKLNEKASNGYSDFSQELNSWTFFAPALVECNNQLKDNGQEGAYKLCILITDGINFDGGEYIYRADDPSIVPGFCEEYISPEAPEKNACADPSADYDADIDGDVPCVYCVEAADTQCNGNPWDNICLNTCTTNSNCAQVCKGKCTTANIASTLKSEALGITMVGILVAEGLSAGDVLDKGVENVQQVSSCNSTELESGTCNNYFLADNFDKLKESATDIAKGLAAEIAAVTNQNTQTICIGDARYLNFLLFALPLFIYLLLKPLQFGVRTIIHKAKPAPPMQRPPPPPVPKKPVVEEPIQEEEVFVDDEDSAAAAAPAAMPVEAKRFKWDIPSSDKYIWASSKGMGHMPVNFATSTNKSAPPSAPKDFFGAKGERVLREAKKWEVADHYEYEKKVEAYVKEEEQLELTLDNVYDGDDFQEVIADVLIDDILEPILEKLCCGYCCCKVMCPSCIGCCERLNDDSDDESQGERMTEMSNLEEGIGH